MLDVTWTFGVVSLSDLGNLSPSSDILFVVVKVIKVVEFVAHLEQYPQLMLIVELCDPVLRTPVYPLRVFQIQDEETIWAPFQIEA